MNLQLMVTDGTEPGSPPVSSVPFCYLDLGLEHAHLCSPSQDTPSWVEHHDVMALLLVPPFDL